MTASNDLHVREHLENASGEIGELMAEVRREVRRELQAAREKAGDLVEGGKDAAADLRDRTAEKVRERPFTSLAIAGGVGLLIGLLVGRRR